MGGLRLILDSHSYVNTTAASNIGANTSSLNTSTTTIQVLLDDIKENHAQISIDINWKAMASQQHRIFMR